MEHLSPALEIAWQAAADEAMREGLALLEPHHLLIGICSIEKFLSPDPAEHISLPSDRRERIQREWEDWVKAVGEAGLDTRVLRRALRQPPAAPQPAGPGGAKIRRSAASQQAFQRAAALAEGSPSRVQRLFHLGAALLEPPEPKIDATFDRLGKRKVELQLVLLRVSATWAREEAPVAAAEPVDPAFQVAERVDASLAPYALTAHSPLEEARAALLYELPLRFGKGGPLTELLAETVTQIRRILPGASHAALLVKDRTSGELLLLAHVPAGAPAISLTLAKRVMDSREACIWVRGEGDATASLDAHGVNCGIYAPLVWQDETLGVFSVSTGNAGRALNREDLRLIVALAHHAAMALANTRFQADLQKKSELLERLLTNFSPRIRNALLAKAGRGRLRLGGEKSEVTLLCSDIRGFTKMSEKLSTDEIVELLNDYFAGLVDAIFQHDGTIDKFLGDGILAVFGSPEPDPAHQEKALRAALAMQKAMSERNEQRRARGLPACEIGIGVHSGEVFHGFIGAADRMEFTVIGDAVNRTARYCAGAQGGEILLSPSLYQRVWTRADVEAVSIATKHEGDFQAYRLKGLKT
jgi:adenylate cyclase